MRKGYKVTISVNKKPLKKLKFKKIKKNKQDENISKAIDIANRHKEQQQEERQERVGKTLVEVKNQLLDIEKERREKLRRRRRIVTICLLCVIGILVYTFITYGPVVGISIYKNEQISEDKKIDFASSEEDIYDTYCDQLLVYNSSKITTYNSNLTKTWEYKFDEIFSPKIYIKGKYMAIVNDSNGSIYLFYNQKELLTKKIDGDISYVYLNDDGRFAVEYSTSGYKKVIGVYSKSGKLLYNSYLSSPSILNVKFLNNNKLLVITSDSSTFNVGITLNIIDGTKQEDNSKEVAKFENNLIYDIVIKGNNAIIMLDNKIVNCNLNTGTISDIKSFESSQALFIALSSNYYTFVEKGLGDSLNNYNIKTIRFDGTDISVTNAENLPKILKCSGFVNYFVYQNSLQVINKWGVELKNININFPPKDIIVFNKEKSVALIYSNKIYFVNI